MPREGSSESSRKMRRHHACHRCRSRKLKCDGTAPCGPCQKAHAFEVRTRPSTAPAEPDCVYDHPALATEGPKSRMAQLEKENADLRELLAAANDKLARCTCGASLLLPVHPPVVGSSISSSTGSLQSLDFPAFEFPMTLPNPQVGRVVDGTSLETSSSLGLSTIQLLLKSSLRDINKPPPLPPRLDILDFPSLPLTGAPEMTFDIVPSIWPQNLPPPVVLHHLVETFFASVPLASRLIHRPTFMAALTLPPSSPGFPHPALLHSICAMGSIYSPIPEISGVAQRSFNARAAGQYNFDELLYGPQNDSFGLAQVYLASADLNLLSLLEGHRLLQMLQASIICTWYAYSMGMSIGVSTFMAAAVNLIRPLGVYTSEGFDPLSRHPPDRSFIFKRPATPLELETLSNVFWIAYVTDRLYNAGFTWPSVIADDDISQMLPCRFSDFIAGENVPTRNRQRIFTDGLFVIHPNLTTDPWTLYVKATILLSKVRSFNCRYRMSLAIDKGREPSRFTESPTESEDFRRLDQAIGGFLREMPRAHRDPVANTVDPILYMAHLIPHVAMLQLHDPHAILNSPNDYSARQMAEAIQSVMDLIYKVSGTSFDLLYMDHACSFCWSATGTAIIQLLKVKMQEQDAVEVKRLEQDLGVIKFVLRNMGDRTVIGHRQAKILEDLYDAVISGLVRGYAHRRPWFATEP